MKILHSESSPGWGGQEIRILREAEGLRERGHQIVFIVQRGGGLVGPAREAGFMVWELNFSKRSLLKLLFNYARIVIKEKVDVINTHSSLDAWIGGVVGRLLRRRLVRTRHLSTKVRGGVNGYLLYNALADTVVTTCQEVTQTLRKSAYLPKKRLISIPTGIDPQAISFTEKEVNDFRQKVGLCDDEILVGTLCVLRGWKGVADLIAAAKLLSHRPKIKWAVVGSGASEDYFKEECRRLGVEDRVIFTGHLSPPFAALQAFDIFALLSWAHEGVSQASLQAAYLGKPLITTATGGLKEVCIDGKTGIRVENNSPGQVARAVERLADSARLRQGFGEAARSHVEQNFLFEQTIDAMDRVVQGRPLSLETSLAP